MHGQREAWCKPSIEAQFAGDRARTGWSKQRSTTTVMNITIVVIQTSRPPFFTNIISTGRKKKDSYNVFYKPVFLTSIAHFRLDQDSPLEDKRILQCSTPRISLPTSYPINQSINQHSFLHGTLMNPPGPQLIIIRPSQKPLTDALIHHKHHLGRHLRAQKRSLFHARPRSATRSSSG